jgi:DNA primase
VTATVSKKTSNKARLLVARELKARVDLASFASQFTRLRRSGRQLLGLCPLHLERHPSFYVHPDKQVFYCFGCGTGGDVYAFVMALRDCGFPEALVEVARIANKSGVAREATEGGRSSVGASPAAAKQQHIYSQKQDWREQILAALNAEDRRLRTIQETNVKASAALATACEPRGEGSSFT